MSRIRQFWATMVLSLAAMAAALIAMTGSASATTITPAGANYTATAGVTKFISNNGTGVDVTCPTATVTGTVPGTAATPAYQFNSLANPGSVIGPINSVQFGNGTNCTADGGVLTGVQVSTPSTPQGWTLTANDAYQDTHGDPAVAVNIPGDQVQISTALGTITAPDDQTKPVAASVIGWYINGTSPQLCVQGQLPFKTTIVGLGLLSQGVFYADGVTDGTSCFTVTNNDTTGPPIAIGS